MAIKAITYIEKNIIKHHFKIKIIHSKTSKHHTLQLIPYLIESEISTLAQQNKAYKNSHTSKNETNYFLP
jgi:hypothetical protein